MTKSLTVRSVCPYCCEQVNWLAVDALTGKGLVECKIREDGGGCGETYAVAWRVDLVTTVGRLEWLD